MRGRRVKKIANLRKERDNFTCQACGYNKIIKGRNIIECHHLSPINMGIRITSILSIDAARRLSSEDVLERLAWLFVTRGIPECLRSDNGSEFTCTAVRSWLAKLGVRTLFIEPGSPWENGYVESFNGKLRDELLDREIFYTLLEAKVLIERWRQHYNRIRPHSSLGYRPPAPEAIAFEALAAGCAPLRGAPLRPPPIVESEGVGLT